MQGVIDRVERFAKATIAQLCNWPRLPVGNPSHNQHPVPLGYFTTQLNNSSGGTGRRNVILRSKLTSGVPDFLSTGSGLVPQLVASTNDPFIVSAANGFKSNGRPDDKFAMWTANTNFPTLTAGQQNTITNYLYVDIDTTTGAASLGASIYPWNDGYQWADYDSKSKILTNFEANPIVDAYGNFNGTTYWTLTGGAVINSSAVKFGTNGLDCSASGRYITLDMQGAGMPTFQKDKWGIGFWAQVKAGAGANARLMAWPFNASFNTLAIGTGTGLGANGSFELQLVTTGTVSVSMSNTVTSVFPVGTWVWVAINFDKSKATENYTLHVNGTKQAAVTNTNLISSGGNDLSLGVFNLSTATTSQPAYFDDLIMLDGYNVPTAAPTAALTRDTVDCYNINKGVMESDNNSGSPISRCRIYIGEADTSGSAVTAVRCYALNGIAQVSQASLAASTQYLLSPLIGSKNFNVDWKLINLTADGNYAVGEQLMQMKSTNFALSVKDRNTLGFTTGATNLGTAQNATSGADFSPAFANWSGQFICRRAY